MHRGYIAIWRRYFEDHPFSQEKRRYSRNEAWIDLLLKTHFRDEPKQKIISGKLYQVNYGEIVTTTRYCGRRWGWHNSTVHAFLKKLTEMRQIRTQPDTRTTRITILNFEKYDIRRNAPPDTEPTRNRHAIDTHRTNIKSIRVQEDKNKEHTSPDGEAETPFYLTRKKKKLTGKRLETFNRFWDTFDYKTGKAEAADAWLEIPQLTNSLVETIIGAAGKESDRRIDIRSNGGTPKMAQGWISGKRWEDEPTESNEKEKSKARVARWKKLQDKRGKDGAGNI